MRPPQLRLSPAAPKGSATKQALFGVYLSTLSLSTTPHSRVGGGISSLHGLRYSPGRPYGSPRRLAWVVGPLWGAWSAWFEALVSVFRAGARCHVSGAGHLALAARGLEWATGAPLAPRFRAPEASHPSRHCHGLTPKAHFWLLLRAHRGVGESCPPPGAPIFSIGGLHMGPQVGWRVLPGPLGCPRLAAFAMGASLAAYRTALAQRPVGA